jgi:hypothetical protein
MTASISRTRVESVGVWVGDGDAVAVGVAVDVGVEVGVEVSVGVGVRVDVLEAVSDGNTNGVGSAASCAG